MDEGQQEHAGCSNPRITISVSTERMCEAHSQEFREMVSLVCDALVKAYMQQHNFASRTIPLVVDGGSVH